MMFASNALPPPTTFAQEHRPLRLVSESSRPQPQGGCHYQSLNGTSLRCLCQTYQHNRSLPGNTCDCGHSACYHSQANPEKGLSPDRVVAALVEKIKKLEDVIVKERQTRHSIAARERQAWEREVHALREALAPFYHSESEMKKRLAQLENKIEYSFIQQARIKDKISAIDHVSTHLERRLDRHEALHTKKRKASISGEVVCVMSPESNYICSSSSAASDTTSVSTQRSPQPPSPANLPVSINGVPVTPRSSGVLNLKPLLQQPQCYTSNEVTKSSVHDEPRSSGFLSIDLADRLRRHKLKSQSPEVTFNHNIPVDTHAKDATKTSHGLPSPPLSKVVPRAIPVSQLLSAGNKNDSDFHMVKRHKQHGGGMLALEILANATVGEPMHRQG